MKLKTLIISFILLLTMGLLSSSAQSVDPVASAKLDTTLVLIGDHVTLQIDVELFDSTFVQFPVYTDTITKDVEILRDLPFDTIRENNKTVIRKQYILTSFDSGSYYINPIAITLRTKESEAQTIYTNPLFLSVQTIQIDSTENRIADIKLPLETPLTINEFISEYLPYLLIMITVGILAFLLIWLIRKTKKQPTEPIVEIPKEEAHVIALRELDALNAKKMWQEGMIKPFYSELSDIIRRYLEHRYEIPALESSTSEIAFITKSLAILDKEIQHKLMEFLETADLVKFAKFEPLASEHLKFMEQSYSFVLKTKIEIIDKEGTNNDATQNKEENNTN
ncbi:MAG: hypothetical protein PHW19_04610 [Salinivirgaceae bacterium]|nr:hypothetical protein [Salinivirgaceae bacterium]